MEWWFWIVLGLAFLGLELALPGGFFLVFFGLAGLILGILVIFVTTIDAWMQWLLFSVLSITFLVAFRKRLIMLLGKSSSSESVDSLVGQEVIVSEAMNPSGNGAVTLRGAPWRAINLSSVALAVGERCQVVAIDGLTLKVDSKKS